MRTCHPDPNQNINYGQHFESNCDIEYADELSCPSTSCFSWPPLSDNNGYNAATASPIYIPPPETQRIQTKPFTQATNEQQISSLTTLAAQQAAQTITNNTATTLQPTSNQIYIDSTQLQDVIDLVPSSWLTQESRSAPELTSINLKEHNALTDNYSDSCTSTCATTTADTTTTSDDYHRIYSYSAQQSQALAQKNQQYYDQSSIDLNSSNCDYEVLSIQQQQGSFSSASTDLMMFSGRRSAQECSDSLYNTINTCQLVNYIRGSAPTSDMPPKPTKKVGFADCVTHVDTDSLVKSESEKDASDNEQPTTTITTTTTTTTAAAAAAEPLGGHYKNVTHSIANPVPQEWTSLMCRALTTASPNTFHITDLPEPLPLDLNRFVDDTQSQPLILPNGESNLLPPSAELPVDYQPPDSEPIQLNQERKPSETRGFLATIWSNATDDNIKQWVQPTKEFVPFPDETDAYFPPDIPLEAIEKHEPIRTKSPFLEALTIASVRPFTPFENDVITQFEDLPRPTKETNLVDALTTAPNMPVNPLNLDLPAETESERFARLEREAQEKRAAEVRVQILREVDSEMKKKCTAFPPFTGFRRVDPFKSLQSPLNQSSRSSSICAGTGEKLTRSSIISIDQSNACTDECAAQSSHSTQINACHANSNRKKSTTAFPPPVGLPAKSYVQSGLQSPKTIPKYQRQWFNLPTQSPIRTPEPHELRENVPIAFCELPQETTESIEKPIAVTVSVPSTDVAIRESAIIEAKNTSIGEFEHNY